MTNHSLHLAQLMSHLPPLLSPPVSSEVSSMSAAAGGVFSPHAAQLEFNPHSLLLKVGTSWIHTNPEDHILNPAPILPHFLPISIPPPALFPNWSNFIDPTALQALCKRRGRQTYTRHQTIELENEFQANAYLTRTRRIVISQTLSLSERQIKIWFQNRRMKQKRERQMQHTSKPGKTLKIGNMCDRTDSHTSERDSDTYTRENENIDVSN